MANSNSSSLSRRSACRHKRNSNPAKPLRRAVDVAGLKDVCQVAVRSLLRTEEAFLSSLARINDIVLQPLLRTDSDDQKGKEHMKLLLLLSDRYHALWDRTEENYKTLKQKYNTSESSLTVHDIYIILKKNLFLEVYTQYFTCFTNYAVVHGFDRAAKQTSGYWKTNKKMLKQLLAPSISEPTISISLHLVLHESIRSQVQQYALILTRLNENAEEVDEKNLVSDALNLYVKLQNFISQSLDEASLTKTLWGSLGSKLVSSLCIPERRLQEDSKCVPVSISTGRFERVLLFDDLLVLQGSDFRSFDLKLVWVDPVSPEKSTPTSHSLRIITPEEEFLLSSKEAQHKAVWQWKLNQVIRQRLDEKRDFPLWGKSEEGLDPCASRFSTYTFKSECRFKNAVYEGEFSWGKPHGKGTLKWPDGHNYVGDFKEGLEDGFGICLIPHSSEDGYDCYKCHWSEGKMQGYGICEYSDESVYKGYFKDNLRHGFGILKSPVSTKHPFKYTGHWDSDKKMGYGIWDDIESGQRYIGMWQNDQRHGAGIVVMQSGACYQGTFLMDKMTGTGILISEDDSVLEGKFTEQLKLDGKGKLTFQNGFTLEGNLNNKAGKDRQTQGVLNTTSKEQDYGITRRLQLGLDEFPVEKRWQGIYDPFFEFISSGCREETEESFLGIHVQTSKELRKSQEYLFCQRDSEEISGKIEDVLEALYECQDPESLQSYLQKALNSSQHPFGKLLKSLSAVFQATYSGIGANWHLLHMAQEEVKYHAWKIWEFYRNFTHVASKQKGKPLPDTEEDTEGSEKENPYTLILPLILPRFHPELFMLYMLYHEKEDAFYWQGIVRLGLFSDTKLLEFLEVQKNLWPLKDLRLTTNQRYSLVRDRCFLSATECFQKIITTVDPREKLGILLKTHEEIETIVSRVMEKEYKLPMDDLLPLLVYVVSRARIQRLGAEIHLIRDLMDPKNEGGIYDFMLTAIESCYEHIQKEEIRLYRFP
ncbi:ALS2 C-terminal-like protein isoform X1 [Microcaecilia unicolor]|uniref:ALS2 C-terminal-like protein isoform X1 n=2 Tax=Microcaecilia unicolor TaxID=1415580 RepID=A0A6P7XQZ8_9AMPH|nr:ALS2 C-terminal-like protein isoform X1 [Microcaecilia unicolor]XP_030053086.1 ALS2 C-terminal-like protein isoform X1 [Microcaecilia unicolor]XP_030053095.1 ALS2 C-terminal-like protein isoform X1 [Microcaecilia unicolor]